MVRVTVWVALVVPIPVGGKVRDEGCINTDPAAPPIPVSTMLAGLVNDEEVTVKAPATVPFVIGVN